MKITLLGDSICKIGYGPLVPSLLGDDFEVYQPEDNCRFSKFTLRGLWDWKEKMAGSRIVHWNNGLWDICDVFGDGPFSNPDEYCQNMLRIADILLARHEKVIFATTTPVNPLHPYNRNERIIEYNRLIVPLLEEKGILINDLHALVVPHVDEYIREDLIHLTDAGARACAQQTTCIIREAAKTLR